MSVSVLMPAAVRMNYTTLLSPSSSSSGNRRHLHHTHDLDIEHDQKSPRTRSTSQEISKQISNEVTTKNDTTIAKQEKNHIKVGSSMILNMQNSLPISRTTCCDLLIKGYLRMYHFQLFTTLPMDIMPILIDYADPLLKWCLDAQDPKILLSSSGKQDEYHLYLNKNDWKSLSISTKYIISDILLEEQIYNDIAYTITIQNDSHFGSNLNDIQWLCQIISTNNHLNKLRISNSKNLLEFNKFHFLLQNSFLKSFNDDIIYDKLTEICIDSYKYFNDECFKMLLDVIDKKCPNLTHLHLWRTDISNESVKELISFLNKNGDYHPLWSIDIEFCTKINDDALKLLCDYLQQNPTKRIYIKCTGKSLFPDQIFEDQRLSVSIYPT